MIDVYKALLTCNRGQISGHRWVVLVFLVELGHVFNVLSVVAEDSLIFIVDAEPSQVQLLEPLKEHQSSGGAYYLLKLLVHEHLNVLLKIQIQRSLRRLSQITGHVK